MSLPHLLLRCGHLFSLLHPTRDINTNDEAYGIEGAAKLKDEKFRTASTDCTSASIIPFVNFLLLQS